MGIRIAVASIALSVIAVGLNSDKIVTQDEPNATENSTSSAAVVSTSSDTSANIPIPTTIRSVAPTVTAVAGVQDVKTNPQSEVGGIEAVNELFNGGDLDRQDIPLPEKEGISNVLLISVAGVVILCLLLAIVVLKKKNDEY